ncbi:patatin-like phospholipase family protein [Pseudomonas sp. HS6]|uniref:patatin-like phospholipase family protein n=1 Tax=Pseudomonas sp. HS6 TaxID=2850559 RepID=UPI002018D406|nr:patatin-like phospholipase family protein [Pseudomonas sp. HS6]UQS16296.1 patatin-like phospholipase family protein [Pseudomonas sp. HS6]
MLDTNDVVAGDAVAPKDRQPLPFATECDLVMKGGITSGIVYPLAIKELSSAFRLRSIGGTSAGAIAAAAAAAAELGRQRLNTGQITDDPQGFAKLAKLPDHFGAPSKDGRGTKLSALFKPLPTLRSTFDVLMACVSDKHPIARAWTVFVVLIGRHWFAGGLVFVAGTLPLWFSESGWAATIWLVVFSVFMLVATLVWRSLKLIIRELPGNGFGLCSGMPGKNEPARDEALTLWLSSYIDDLAGQAQAFPDQQKPLTFADLDAHNIDLQMMTTCLTLGRPFRLPFDDVENVRDNKQFMFRRSEFTTLFPANVVDWMVAKARPKNLDQNHIAVDEANADDLFNLPAPGDLPVILAARMSLSFPLLLSAIPLYAIDYRKKSGQKKVNPERCWFTDGGVGSNFPIHFFDLPLPTRPTFGLDLGLADSAVDQRVVFAKDNGDARLTYWRRFTQGGGAGSIVGFLSTVVNVAKDWNHETLSHLPGFRDRIGLIRLTKEEGGLNLAMPQSRILQLSEYGAEAGREFVARFGAPGSETTMNWENHQLVRLRLLLASLDEQFQHLRQGMSATAGTTSDYARFFSHPVGPQSYRFTGLGKLLPDAATGLYASQAGLANWTLDQLLSVSGMIEGCQKSAPGTRLDKSAPKPLPELKLRPRV